MLAIARSISSWQVMGASSSSLVSASIFTSGGGSPRRGAMIPECLQSRNVHQRRALQLQHIRTPDADIWVVTGSWSYDNYIVIQACKHRPTAHLCKQQVLQKAGCIVLQVLRPSTSAGYRPNDAISKCCNSLAAMYCRAGVRQPTSAGPQQQPWGHLPCRQKCSGPPSPSSCPHEPAGLTQNLRQRATEDLHDMKALLEDPSWNDRASALRILMACACQTA